MGGLSRRNTVIENQRKKGPLMVVDAGGSLVAHSVNADQIGQHALEQRRLKADLIGEAYAQAGIDAIGLNAADWTLGGAWVREMVAKHDLPVVAGNLVCAGESPFPGHKIVEVAGRRIGVVGITFGAVDGCEVTDPRKSLEASIAAVGDVDLVLALAPGNEPTKLGLALEGKPVLGIDLLLDGRGRHSYRAPDNMSGVWMMGAGSRGKSVGQVDFVWTDGATQWAPAGQENQNQIALERAMQRLASTQKRFDEEADEQRKSRWGAQVKAYEEQLATLQATLEKPTEASFNLFTGSVVDLDKSVRDHPTTHALVDQAKENMSSVAGDPSQHLAPHRTPASSPYAGSDLCATCHNDEHLQWADTPHANALATLVEEKRHMDDSCYYCHTTGARQKGGPQEPAMVGGFRDVQCEACHGPARSHATHPADASLLPDPGTPKKMCAHCHDGERDGGRFVLEEYYPKILHGVKK